MKKALGLALMVTAIFAFAAMGAFANGTKEKSSSSSTSPSARLSSTSRRPRSASRRSVSFATGLTASPSARRNGFQLLFTTCSPLLHRRETRGSVPHGHYSPCAMPKALIIEDDDVIADGMSRHLVSAGFDPIWANKGESGLARLRYENPDVCVLDLMLPGLDGWRLIVTARGAGIGTPLVVVSARGTEHDRIHALEIGADDYLVKPFSMKELVARVQAAARRSGQAAAACEAEVEPVGPAQFRLAFQPAQQHRHPVQVGREVDQQRRHALEVRAGPLDLRRRVPPPPADSAPRPARSLARREEEGTHPLPEQHEREQQIGQRVDEPEQRMPQRLKQRAGLDEHRSAQGQGERRWAGAYETDRGDVHQKAWADVSRV